MADRDMAGGHCCLKFSYVPFVLHHCVRACVVRHAWILSIQLSVLLTRRKIETSLFLTQGCHQKHNLES